ncbi:MAG: hypothetical protein H0X27_03020, partial [Caulobacteraceae bacterium]|nr:hypothetical protein [Caulobacteraceae bacterium]
MRRAVSIALAALLGAAGARAQEAIPTAPRGAPAVPPMVGPSAPITFVDRPSLGDEGPAP